MSKTPDALFQPIWDETLIKKMTDAELIREYQAIKEHLNLVDPYYLTEICARRLLPFL